MYIYSPNFFLYAKLFSFQIKMKNQNFLSKKKEDKNRMGKKKKKILGKNVMFFRKKKELNSAIEGICGNAGNLKYLVTCVQKKLHL